jgi:RNA polymerase subunit RPABC4/transcription elongation factor Spt4
MKIRHCPECGRSIPLDSKVCPYCAKTIPMHEGQIVTKPDDDKSNIILIIVAVVVISIFVTIAIAASVYVYISGQIDSHGPWATPTITFSKQDLSAYNSLNVVYTKPSDIDWIELELRVDGNAVDHGMYGIVSKADSINITSIAGTGEYSISIIYMPTKTILGSWDFTGEK